MRRLNAREQKLVAVGLLVLLLAVVWLAVAAPILGGFAARQAERERLTDTYARNQRTLAGIAVWRAEIDQQRRTAAQFQIVAPSAPLAADLLRDRVARAFSAQGGQVKAVQDLPLTGRPGWVAVRADVRLTLAQLNAALARLENEPPLVRIDYFAVSAERAVETGREGPIELRIDVSGRTARAR